MLCVGDMGRVCEWVVELCLLFEAARPKEQTSRRRRRSERHPTLGRRERNVGHSSTARGPFAHPFGPWCVIRGQLEGPVACGRAGWGRLPPPRTHFCVSPSGVAPCNRLWRARVPGGGGCPKACSTTTHSHPHTQKGGRGELQAAARESPGPSFSSFPLTSRLCETKGGRGLHTIRVETPQPTHPLTHPHHTTHTGTEPCPSLPRTPWPARAAAAANPPVPRYVQCMHVSDPVQPTHPPTPPLTPTLPYQYRRPRPPPPPPSPLLPSSPPSSPPPHLLLLRPTSPPPPPQLPPPPLPQPNQSSPLPATVGVFLFLLPFPSLSPLPMQASSSSLLSLPRRKRKRRRRRRRRRKEGMCWGKGAPAASSWVGGWVGGRVGGWVDETPPKENGCLIDRLERCMLWVPLPLLVYPPTHPPTHPPSLSLDRWTWASFRFD